MIAVLDTRGVHVGFHAVIYKPTRCWSLTQNTQMLKQTVLEATVDSINS
jgi:hypothetical protein